MLRYSLVLILFIGGNALWLGRKLEVKSEEGSNSVTAQAKMQGVFFDFGGCLAKMPLLTKLAADGARQCKHVFSCNNFWANEVQIEVTTGSFCFLNAYERNVPQETRITMDAAHTNYLRIFVSPIWDLFMKRISMMPGNWEEQELKFKAKAENDIASATLKASVGPAGSNMQVDNRYDFKTYVNQQTGTDSFVQTDHCDGEQLSGGDQLKCMMTQLRRIYDKTAGSTNLGKVSMSTEQAADMKETLQRVHSGMQLLEVGHKERARALEQGPGDIRGMDFGPEDDVPIPGPLENSLSSPSRYGHAQPGLNMKGDLLTTIDPLAKCNDGSPGIYYLSEGSKEKFHLHLGGGYFCYNKQNCIKRIRASPMLGSSRGYEMSFTGSGLFDPANGGLEGWTHGTFSYCSSDAFFGQVDIDEFQVVSNTFIRPNVTGTHFRGYTMVQAMLRLYVRMGLGSAAGHELIVSGCSAGSIGVTAQADSFIPRVKAIFHSEYGGKTFHAPSIVTISDNMPILSPQPVTVNFNGKLALFDQAMELVNHLYVSRNLLDRVPEFLNQNCAAAYPENVAACVFPEQVLEHVQTPNLVLNNLMDTFLLFNPAAFFQPGNAEQEAFARMIGEDMRAQIRKIAPKQNQWAIECNDHCFTLNAWWWRLKPVSAPNDMHNTSPRDMMHLTMRGQYQLIAMDECRTYNCGCIGFAQFYQAAGAYQVSQNLANPREGMKLSDQKFNWELRMKTK